MGLGVGAGKPTMGQVPPPFLHPLCLSVACRSRLIFRVGPLITLIFAYRGGFWAKDHLEYGAPRTSFRIHCGVTLLVLVTIISNIYNVKRVHTDIS